MTEADVIASGGGRTASSNQMGELSLAVELLASQLKTTNMNLLAAESERDAAQQAFQSRIAENTKTVEQLATELKDATAARDAYCDEVTTLRREVQLLTKRIVVSNANAFAERDRADRATEELQRAQARTGLKVAEAAHGVTEAQLDSANLQLEILNLRGELNAAFAREQKACDERDKALLRVKSSRVESAAAVEHLRAYQQQAVALQAMVGDMRSQLEQARHELGCLSEQVSDLRAASVLEAWPAGAARLPQLLSVVIGEAGRAVEHALGQTGHGAGGPGMELARLSSLVSGSLSSCMGRMRRGLALDGALSPQWPGSRVASRVASRAPSQVPSQAVSRAASRRPSIGLSAHPMASPTGQDARPVAPAPPASAAGHREPIIEWPGIVVEPSSTSGSSAPSQHAAAEPVEDVQAGSGEGPSGDSSSSDPRAAAPAVEPTTAPAQPLAIPMPTGPVEESKESVDGHGEGQARSRTMSQGPGRSRAGSHDTTGLAQDLSTALSALVTALVGSGEVLEGHDQPTPEDGAGSVIDASASIGPEAGRQGRSLSRGHGRGWGSFSDTRGTFESSGYFTAYSGHSGEGGRGFTSAHSATSGHSGYFGDAAGGAAGERRFMSAHSGEGGLGGFEDARGEGSSEEGRTAGQPSVPTHGLGPHDQALEAAREQVETSFNDSPASSLCPTPMHDADGQGRWSSPSADAPQGGQVEAYGTVEATGMTRAHASFVLSPGGQPKLRSGWRSFTLPATSTGQDSGLQTATTTSRLHHKSTIAAPAAVSASAAGDGNAKAGQALSDTAMTSSLHDAAVSPRPVLAQTLPGWSGAASSGTVDMGMGMPLGVVDLGASQATSPEPRTGIRAVRLKVRQV